MSAAPPSPTPALALRAAVARLAAAGVAGAPRDARLLLADAMGVDPGRLTLHLHDALPPEAAARFEAAVAARAGRRPVSQILGRRAFWGRDFRVTADVLDPRPETEVLVALALAEPFSCVLDLGTGTGAILLTLLAERPGAAGVGTDVSPAALAVARGNAAALGVAADFLLSDWFSGVTGRFDLIVSNPPYIALAEMAALSPEVRDHEPHLALTDGGDGLAAYRAIAAGAAAHLAPGGRILLEIGPTQGPAVAALLAGAGFTGVAIHPDLDARDRVVAARAPLA
ncbi:peptide chain release factor N(5)-glutamine methyltransferase [Ruixingdingia sedimenti]|uniref:Release factor glutamine methyltransferase n=1 Tax=Ruixingdingia sedimenti TaxID=3073604 RepID=A0ABU1F7X4_9RHOB|nr:peptide chain release factor N(5)-glutamine methyltransferase [Xinfangfangia sp. LG-4]MDR5652976.1 peptide chain release factor N(5)-glutamine methyltransferase [Xinfangfangia sp. LG-4]